MTSGSLLQNFPMPVTLSLLFHTSHPLPRPRLPRRHLTTSWASSLKGGLLLLFPSVSSPETTTTYHRLYFTLTSSSSSYPFHNTMSNNVNFCHPCHLRPLLRRLLSPNLSINPSLSPSPKNPSLLPSLSPSPHIQTNPVTEYTMHTKDHLRRIRTFHIPTYALDGVRESLQRGDRIAFLAQSEASL